MTWSSFCACCRAGERFLTSGSNARFEAPRRFWRQRQAACSGSSSAFMFLYGGQRRRRLAPSALCAARRLRPCKGRPGGRRRTAPDCGVAHLQRMAALGGKPKMAKDYWACCGCADPHHLRPGGCPHHRAWCAVKICCAPARPASTWR
jgi:hypothetical protein